MILFGAGDGTVAKDLGKRVKGVNFDLNCPQVDSAERGGIHSSSSSPQRKHAINTESKGPTGTNDSMASGGQGAQTTPKAQTAQRRTDQHRKKKPRGQRPKPTKPNPEGKPTKARQPQRECKWARPINRKVTHTNKHSMDGQGTKESLAHEPTNHAQHQRHNLCL